MKLLNISLIVAITLLLLTACGNDSSIVTYIEVPTESLLIVHDLPDRGACVQISEDLWAENEGNHVDIYNNPDCDHSGGTNEVICNDLREVWDEVCWIGTTNFTVEGTYSDTKLYEVSF